MMMIVEYCSWWLIAVGCLSVLCRFVTIYVRNSKGGKVCVVLCVYVCRRFWKVKLFKIEKKRRKGIHALDKVRSIQRQ